MQLPSHWDMPLRNAVMAVLARAAALHMRCIVHMQAHTSLQQRLAGAELDWDKERKQSSAQLDAVQDQLKQLQGHYNQATADLEVLLTASGAAVVVALVCCVALHLWLITLSSIPHRDNAPLCQMSRPAST